jgi:hypothetical protein
MTLITPCKVPTRSPWHYVTGGVVFLVAYVGALLALKLSVG